MSVKQSDGKDGRTILGWNSCFVPSRKCDLAFVAGYCFGEMLIYICMSGSSEETLRNPVKICAYLLLMPVFTILDMFGLLNPAPEYIWYIAPGAFYGFAAAAMTILGGVIWKSWTNTPNQ